MTLSQFALVTPSFSLDFERCKLLVESVQKFSQAPLTHYLIVDQRDYRLFSPLANSNTEVLTVESLLPYWLKRVPMVDRVWFSFKTLPVRNWIIQQLVKIAFARNAPEPITIFADSDVTFIKPFNFNAFCQQDQVRLFRVPAYYSEYFEKWYENAFSLLGVDGYCYGIPRPNYIGNLISWQQQHVRGMCDRIEQLSGRSWIETLASTKTLSEYVLYGTYVDHVLGAAAGHFYDWEPRCREYWETNPMTDEQLRDFFGQVQPENIAVMISAKAGIDPNRYARYVLNPADSALIS